MADILSFGAYVPYHRLGRSVMGEAWGVPAVPGERAVANADEDSVTMAVAAGLDCLAGVDAATLDGIYFATTTPPYHEKQGAAIIAAALDLRRDIFTADFTDSVRGATVALRAAVDAVTAGSAKRVLVVAADVRMGEPESMWEQLLGDGAAAIVVGDKGFASIHDLTSVAGDQLGPWRRADDRYVRSFEAKVDTEYGYARNTVQAVKTTLEQAGVAPADVTKAVITAVDPRSHAGVAKALGLDPTHLQDTLFLSTGNAGAAHVLLMLAAALEGATAGDRLLVANYGDGSDAFLLDVKSAPPPPDGRRGLSGYLAWRRPLAHYTEYARFRRLVDREQPEVRSSPVIYWRDAQQELNFRGARCKSCKTVQYPVPRVCTECGSKDSFEDVKLARRGTVFTFTLDHLAGGVYLNTPIPRVVTDLEGGGRVFLEMTDCDPTEVKVGMTVELTFRHLHEGAAFHNYYWKCRPVPA